MNNSNSHKISQLIHAGIELVIGACITFWLNRKISTVSQKVSLIEDKLKFYESMLSQHHDLIKKLFSIMETTTNTPKIEKMAPPPLVNIDSNVDNLKTELLLPLSPLPTAVEKDPGSSFIESVDSINKENDSMAELDAILSVEIKDLQKSAF